MGRVASNFGDRGGRSKIWSSPTFASGCHFFLWAALAAYKISSILLAVLSRDGERGMGKATSETWVEQ